MKVEDMIETLRNHLEEIKSMPGSDEVRDEIEEIENEIAKLKRIGSRKREPERTDEQVIKDAHSEMQYTLIEIGLDSLTDAADCLENYVKNYPGSDVPAFRIKKFGEQIERIKKLYASLCGA